MVDDQCSHRRVEYVEGPGPAAQQRSFGEHFSCPRLAGDDRGESKVRFGRFTGRRIDQVVAVAPSRVQTRRSTLDVATAPCLNPTSAIGVAERGCSIASVQPDPAGLSPTTRRSPPMLTQAPATPSAISSVATRSAANPLPIPPGSNDSPAGRVTVASSTTMSVQPDACAVPAAGELFADFCGRAELLERTVVAGAQEVVEKCRIERSAGEPPRLDGAIDEETSVRRDGHRVTGPLVERGHLAVGPEPAPAALQLLDAGDCPSHRPVVAADDEEMGVRAHRSEAMFKRGRKNITSTSEGRGGHVDEGTTPRLAASSDRLKIG